MTFFEHKRKKRRKISKRDQEWVCLGERFNATVLADGINLPNKRVDPGFWLRSGFEFPRRQLVVSLFLDPISCGRYTVQRR